MQSFKILVLGDKDVGKSTICSYLKSMNQEIHKLTAMGMNIIESTHRIADRWVKIYI